MKKWMMWALIAAAVVVAVMVMKPTPLDMNKEMQKSSQGG